MASTINPAYQDALAQLYQKLAASLADYDYAEQQKRRDYESQLYGIGQDRTSSIRSNQVNMADRGLTQSGIALQGNVDLNNAYDTKQMGAAGQYSADLSSIARKRLADEAAYNLQKAQFERQSAAQNAISAGISGGGGGRNGGSGGFGIPQSPAYNQSPSPVIRDSSPYRSVSPVSSTIFGPPAPKPKKLPPAVGGGGLIRSM